MQIINIKDAKDLIRHVAVGMNEPVMLWGQPGVGKSEAVAQVCAADDGMLVDIRLSQYDAVDLRGIPVPQSGLTVWHAPSTLPFEGNDAFPDDRRIYLFLDEINSAASSVAAVAYQLINDRGVGEHRLKDNVVVIAAGNREADRGVTNRMPTPLANRFTHAEIGVDVDAWCEYAQDAGLPAVGIAFMQFRKPLLSTFDPSKPDKAFATPRTWVKALRYHESDMPSAVKNAAMTGAVGEGPAAEFLGFVDVWESMISVEDIMADPDGIAMPEELSTRYAVAVSVSGALSAETAEPLHRFLQRMDPEYVVLAWKLALQRDDSLYTTDEFMAFSKTYRAVFQ
jgi:hypothetical protein